MGFDLDDYEKWAGKYRREGGEPCIKKYLENKIKSMSAQEANNHRWNKLIIVKIGSQKEI